MPLSVLASGCCRSCIFEVVKRFWMPVKRKAANGGACRSVVVKVTAVAAGVDVNQSFLICRYHSTSAIDANTANVNRRIFKFHK